ncbi:NosD domain-containing protein [Candidatus Azoamicus ciliaticola]|uniref:Putative ABC transporter binding protein NosD n=1 Tax=Candidatus Azoamicus ciliaticola TaxID=2652803 RepID=A0A6J5JWP9_9GAMM|nr:NosD domain-containing protein [Candidatus Azoamicus ciliaticola]CAB3976454.1 putative ABC transporter binding protein NosD [Candidatus Azoamicus ciliaticola]
MDKILIFIFIFFFFNVSANSNKHVHNSYDLLLALTNSKNGESIILESGVYVGNFVINKSINFISNGNVVLTSGGVGNILTIESSNVNVKGILFYNSGKDMSVSDSCIFINGSNVNIINNFFSECGFSLWSNESTCNYFFNNIFIGGFDDILSDRGNTLHLYRNINSVIADNFIINGRDGVYITNSNEVSINRNIFTNVRFGIHYMFSNKCNVVSNIVCDSMIGIAVMYSKYVDLINNFAYSNVTHGLFFRDVLYSRILRNKSLYNKDGVLFGDSYFNDVINNDIIKNNVGMKVYSGSDDNLVYDNNFISNNLQVQFLDNRKIVWNSNSIGNFWSNYVGWDLNFDGIGDKKFYVTNISDWILSSYPILKIMFNSPALVLLQKIENQFPSFRKFSIIDNYPLMRPIIW